MEREVVEMTSLTCDHKARGENGWLVQPVTVPVDVASTIGLEWVGFEFEVAGLQRSELTTVRAEHSARERRDGDADARQRIERALRGYLGDGWCVEF